MPLSSELKAVALHNSSFIRSAHNSFPAEDKENCFFFCFFPKKGKVVEVDGLANGPVYLGEGNEDDWLERAKHSLLEKICGFREHNVNFSLLAVVDNKVEMLEKNIKATNKQILAIKKKFGEKAEDFYSKFYESLTDDKEALNSELLAKEELKSHQESVIKNEKSKKLMWTEERIRKKHNYTPFIVALLKKLNEKNQLSQLIEQNIKKKTIST